mmetsp:Transcript_104629/g.165219  ORF Transcript_104629/g.165219 Transcript_104629/m.165219 type:complete len:157 (-) Transcript_104629:25-495(-)
MVEVHIPKKNIHGRLEPTPSKVQDEDELPDELLLLQVMAEQVATTIGRLEKSNRELNEALLEGDDADFREAVSDNLKILEYKRSHEAAILEKIQQLTAAASCQPSKPFPQPPVDNRRRDRNAENEFDPAARVAMEQLEGRGASTAIAPQIPDGLDL